MVSTITIEKGYHILVSRLVLMDEKIVNAILIVAGLLVFISGLVDIIGQATPIDYFIAIVGIVLAIIGIVGLSHGRIL